MKGILFVDSLALGEVDDLKVLDRSMGVIGGTLLPNKNYDQYRERFYACVDDKGIANMQDFNFVFVLADGTRCEPQGGIGLTHWREEPNVISVEVFGVALQVIRSVDTRW